MSISSVLAAFVLGLIITGSCHAADCGATLLRLHNYHRAWHQAGALQWDASLSGSAQSWAHQLASEGCHLHHSGPGENLYASWGSSADPCYAAAEAWANEVSSYVFSARPWSDNQGNFHAIGHFTQMVWRSATRLGCGVAAGSGNCKVVVCHYDHGNLEGDQSFAENVKPVSSSSGGAPTTGSGSQDRLQWCSSWASHGYCGASWVYQGVKIRDWCPASCAGGRRRAAARRLADATVVAENTPQPTETDASGMGMPIPEHVGTVAGNDAVPVPVRSKVKAA